MNNGFWKGDSIAQAAEKAFSDRNHASEVDYLNSVIEQLKKRREELFDDVSANLAEKYALRKALAKLDPKHPLIANDQLRSRIHEAGIRASRITNTFQAAKEAGDTFKY